VNSLNAYINRTVPGAVDVIGAAKATASVTVNSASVTTRKGEYYWKEVSVANGSAAVWQNLSVTATEGANNQNSSGNLFVPQTPEVFVYDADGNLTTNGQWVLTWDGENRLTRMVANTAVGPQQRIDFEYDWQGRRIAKKVWNDTAGTSGPKLSERFLYDGWNLVAQLNATNNAVVRSYLWGTDLSGSLQGAGGVAGLLAVSDAANGTHFASFDGNGNVMALVSATDGSISARYEYGPFGELIRATGPLAFLNPFRFSTKFQDDETGFLYYGYRYYDPSTGRWPNRDPINEPGFNLLISSRGAFNWDEERNLYAFVRNNGVNNVDPLGQSVLAPVAGWIGTDCAVPDPTDAAWPKWAVYGIALCAAAAIDACLPEKCLLIIVLKQEEMGDPADLDGNYWPAMKICIYRCTKSGRIIRRYQSPESQCAPSVKQPK
jgi:RHS repeat-associated protein